MAATEDYPTHAVQTLTGHVGPVFAVRFNNDGQYCLSGGHDKLIKLWNPHKGKLIKTYVGYGREVSGLAVAKDNTKFASCGGERLAYIWDVATGRIIRKYQGHFERINGVDFNEDSTVLASGSYDATVRLWDLRSNSFEPIQVLSEAKDSVTCVRFAKHHILTSSVDGCIREYDIRMGIIQVDHIEHPVTSVCYSNDNNTILASSLDSTVRLIDKENGEVLSSYAGHKNTSYKIESCLSNKDAYVFSGSEDNKVYGWDLVESKLVATLTGHTGAVMSLAYHREDIALLTASTDGTVKLWTQ